MGKSINVCDSNASQSMSEEAYEEGDFIQVRDVQAANATIGFSGDIEKGAILKISHKSGDFLVCESVELTETVRVKPFPIDAGNPISVAPGDDVKRWGQDRKVLKGDEEDIAADVSEFLSNQADVTSDSIK